MVKKRLCVFLTIMLLIIARALEVDAKGTPKEAQPATKIEKDEISSPSITEHSITVNGQSLKYTSTAGYLEVGKKSAKADIFFVAYKLAHKKDEPKNKVPRPITFAFNGGPGASSVFLHLGALGPRRIFLKDEGQNAAPPYHLVDNEYTWLKFTDLVFIDPMGTGYSRPGHEVNPKQFYGLKEDIRLVGDFIRLYLTKYKRWSSPKFMAGESYGTTRAVGLSGYLQDKLNININGLVLISPALDFQAIMFKTGNDLPYPLFLPSYTAAAWYHKKLSPDLQSKDLLEVLEEAQNWAMNEYSLALLKGDAIADSEREVVIEKLARYTALSKDFIDKHNLRLDQEEFSRKLLGNRLLGLMDSRFEGVDPDPECEYYKYDPALFLFKGPFGAAMNDYARNELNYVNDSIYQVINDRVTQSWNWGGHNRQGFTNVTQTLRKAMSKNKELKVFIASGYYDLTTPYWVSDYTVNHLGLDPSLRGNITISHYTAGHMIYIHLPSLEKLTKEVAAFINKAY